MAVYEIQTDNGTYQVETDEPSQPQAQAHSFNPSDIKGNLKQDTLAAAPILPSGIVGAGPLRFIGSLLGGAGGGVAARKISKDVGASPKVQDWAEYAGNMAGGLLGDRISGDISSSIPRPTSGVLPSIPVDLEKAIDKIPVVGKSATGAYGILRHFVNPEEQAKPSYPAPPVTFPQKAAETAPVAAPPVTFPARDSAPAPKVYPAPPVKFKRPVKPGLLAQPQGPSTGLLAPEGSIAVPPVPGTQGLTGRYQQIGGDFAQNIAANAAEKDRAFASHLSSKGVKPEEFSSYTPQQIEELRKEVNSTYGKKYSKSRRGDDAFKSDVLNMMQTTRSAGGGLL